jgi:hypothetical protein
MLAGRSREAVLVGEAKLRRVVDARPIVASLERKAERLPWRSETLRYAVAAPFEVQHAPAGVLTVTAVDIFGIPGEKQKAPYTRD